MQLVAILEDIRSLHNVGSIFRTADALGVTKLYLIGQTGHPHPEEPWRPDHIRLQKTALGAQEIVPWEYRSSTVHAINELRRDGFTIISLELTAHSFPLDKWKRVSGKFVLIVGNEVTGISPKTLAASDHVLHIPMHGAKESLNVSVAFGIAAFELSQ